MPHYNEWRQTNSERNYPFADDASLVAESGQRLSSGAFLDAVLHPPGVVTPLYLSKIEGTQLTISAVGTREEVAVGTPEVSGSIVFRDSYNRMCGRIVYGDDFSAGQDLTFTETAAPFNARCVIPVNVTGVEGFLLPDGSVVSGPVRLISDGSVKLTVEGQKITIDAVGSPAPPSCVTLPPAIKCIRTVQSEQNALNVTMVAGVITLAHSATREEICDPDKLLPDSDGKLPGEDSRQFPCMDYPPPEYDPDAGFPPSEITMCQEVSGQLHMNSLSDAILVTPGEDLNTLAIRLRGMQ